MALGSPPFDGPVNDRLELVIENIKATRLALEI